MGMRTVVEAITGQRTRGTLEVAGTAVPWTDVHRQARLVAGRLAARGVRPGDRVALLGDTDVDLVTAIQATWLAGAAVTVLPQPATDPAHLRRILGDARPRLVLTASPDRLPVADLANLADLAATGPATGPLPDPPDPGDLAILQYTSGSTRAPRGVPVKHAHLAANIDAIRAATDHDRIHRRTVSWLPLYHDMGLVGVLCTMMACGCDLVLVPTAEFAARPLAWLDQLAATRATMTAAPNFAWGLAARLLAATPTLDLSAVRVAVSGGEPIDPTTMTRFLAAAARHGFDPGALVCAYGLAEATLAVTMTRPGTGLRTDVVDPAGLERHSVAVPADGGRPLTRLGRPVAGTRVRIVNDTGEAG
ncbi:AMP-binding protein, partial [Asanoa sp. NPDC050611]|uniref:AMP-binding protein n=1 Tax=Asanoa sp. NPDC050611 TaxID=3157098 RepID=UPI0033CB7197